MSNTQPYTVMTVCTGNICRSPMGEIILRHFFNERGLGDQVNVESSGVSDEEWSHPIDPRAVRVLRERGYGDEIPRDHFAHRISREEIDRTDLFLPMTASHMRALLRMLPAGKRAEVHMYRSFDPNLPKPKPGREDHIYTIVPPAIESSILRFHTCSSTMTVQAMSSGRPCEPVRIGVLRSAYTTSRPVIA